MASHALLLLLVSFRHENETKTKKKFFFAAGILFDGGSSDDECGKNVYECLDIKWLRPFDRLKIKMKQEMSIK